MIMIRKCLQPSRSLHLCPGSAEKQPTLSWAMFTVSLRWLRILTLSEYPTCSVLLIQKTRSRWKFNFVKFFRPKKATISAIAVCFTAEIPVFRADRNAANVKCAAFVRMRKNQKPEKRTKMPPLTAAPARAEAVRLKARRSLFFRSLVAGGMPAL